MDAPIGASGFDSILFENAISGGLYGMQIFGINVPDDMSQNTPSERDGSQPHTSRVFDDSSDQVKPLFTWSLDPFRFVYRRITIPVIGLIDIVVQKSTEIGVTVLSPFYAALPLLTWRRTGVGARILQVSRADVTGPSIEDFEICSCGSGFLPGLAPVNQSTPCGLVSTLCTHRVRSQFCQQYLPVNWEQSAFNHMNNRGRVVRVGATRPTTTPWAALLSHPDGPRPAHSCPHPHIDDVGVLTTSKPLDLVMADGLGYHAPHTQHRAGLRYGGLRCTICYTSTMHGWAPELVRFFKGKHWDALSTNLKVSLATTVAAFLEFEESLDPELPYYLVGVSVSRATPCILPTTHPVIVLVDSDATFDVVSAQNPKATLLKFWVPVIGTDRSLANWRVVFGLLTKRPGPTVVVNSVKSSRFNLEVNTIIDLGFAASSVCTGHFWPCFLGAAVYRPQKKPVMAIDLLASMARCGFVYGWDEWAGSWFTKPVIVTWGDSVAPGIRAPLVHPLMLHTDDVFVAFGAEPGVVTSVHKMTFDRRNIHDVRGLFTRLTAWGGLTFWHVFTDPRPTFLMPLNARMPQEVANPRMSGRVDLLLEDPDLGPLGLPMREYVAKQPMDLLPLVTRSEQAGSNVLEELVSEVGGVTFLTFGTRGDRVPVEALARHIARHNAPVDLVHLVDPDEGKELLLSVTQGTNPPIDLMMRARSTALAAARGLVFYPAQLGSLPGLAYSMAPPLDIIKPLVVSANIWVTIGHALLGLVTDVTCHIGAYTRPRWLPRSADGRGFLQPIRNSDSGKLAAVWGSDGVPPEGYENIPVITETNHPVAFSKYSTIVCHGGAGTVQTISASGARAVVAQPALLDRAYRNPNDAGLGVRVGGDPDNIFLALADHDIRFLAVWLRRNMWRPWRLLAWFGPTGVAWVGFRALMLYLLLSREHRLAIISSDPLSTLFVVLSRWRPSYVGMVALFFAARVVDAVIENLNISYYHIGARLVSTAQRVAVSPIALILAQRYSLLAGAAYAELAIRLHRPLTQWAQVIANMCFGVRSVTPSGVFLEYKLALSPIPVLHTALVSPMHNERYEGVGTFGGLYSFKIIQGSVQSPILIPTNLNWESVRAIPPAVGYYGAAWNCQTGLLINLQDSWHMLGIGVVGLMLTATFAATLLGVIGAGTVVTYGLLHLLPTSVGIVPTSSTLGEMVEVVVKELFARTAEAPDLTPIAILRWWRNLSMPFAASHDDLVIDATSLLEQYNMLPVLYQHDKDTIALYDDLLAGYASRGVPLAITNIMRSNLVNNQIIGTDTRLAYNSAVEAAKLAIQASPAYANFLRLQSVASLDDLKRDVVNTIPPSLVDQLIVSEAVLQAGTAITRGSLSRDDRVLLASAVRTALKTMADVIVGPLYLHSCREIYQALCDSYPFLTNILEVLYSEPDAPLGLRGAQAVIIGDDLFRDALLTGLTCHITEDEQATLAYVDYWTQLMRHSVLLGQSTMREALLYVWPKPVTSADVDDNPVLPVVAEIVGSFLAVYKSDPNHKPTDFQTDAVAAYAAHMLLEAIPPISEAFDMPLRKWLWSCYQDTQPVTLTVMESTAQWLVTVREFCTEWSMPFGVFNTLSNILSAIGLGLYELADKAIDLLVHLLINVFKLPWANLHEYAYLGRGFVSALLPESRRRPKAVWALLFANDFTRLTPGQKFAISCRAMAEPEASDDYEAWSSIIADKINGTGLADKLLEPKLPLRPYNYPKVVMTPDPEAIRLAPLMAKTTVVAEAIAPAIRSWAKMADVQGIDGAWFATGERIERSIQRYDVDRLEPDDHTLNLVLQTAHALADKYPSMYKDAEYLSPRSAINKIKVKYSPGLPFIPDFRDRKALRKHGFLRAITRVAEDVLRDGIHPGTTAHCFVKSDVVSLGKLLAGKNIRTVIAQDLLGNLLSLCAMVETTRRLPPVDSWVMNSVPRSEGGFRPFYEELLKRRTVFQADAQEFDSKLGPVITVDGLAELRSIGYDGSAIEEIARSQIRASYLALRHALLVDLNTGRTHRHTGGLMTGQANTSADNRDSFRLMYIAAWVDVTGKTADTFWDTNTLGNAGDDDAIGTDDPPDTIPLILNRIKDLFGVTVVVESTGKDNLDLVGLSLGDVPVHSIKYYGLASVPVPDFSVSVTPSKLLLKKTEFKTRLASLKDVSFYMAYGVGIAGSAYLTAHQPWIYEEFARNWTHSATYIGLRFFESISFDEARDETGALVRVSARLGKVRARYASSEVTLRAWWRKNKFPTYAQIMGAWLRPFDPARSALARRHHSLLGFMPKISALERATWGLVGIREALYTWIPNHVARSLPEFVGEDVTYVMRNSDYTVAKFVWLSLYHKGGRARPPSSSLFRTAIRESPYGSAEDPVGFLNWLSVRKNFNKLISEDLELYRGKMFTITIVYACIEIIFKSFKSVPILSFLTNLYALSTRDVNRLYAALNHVYMLATGRSSPIISNMMPSDPYAWIKQFAIVIANTAPIRWHAYPGLRTLVGWLPLVVEVWAGAAATVSPRVFHQISRLVPVPNLWMDVIDAILGDLDTGVDDLPKSHLVVAPTGTGKSTAFLGALLAAMRPTIRFWLLCPTKTARDNYHNPFVAPAIVTVLSARVVAPAGTRIFVLTYGHFRTRLLMDEVRPSDVILFDEAHLGTPVIHAAWALTTSHIRIQLTATPTSRYRPDVDKTTHYRGLKRFTTNVQFFNGEVSTVVTHLASNQPHLITRMLIVLPTKRKVSEMILTLGRLSITGWELSSDVPTCRSTGSIVATTIVDTAITIEPAPTVLIDSGVMLKITVDGSGVFLTTSAAIVPTDLSTHTQRLGRVGRLGDGLAYCVGLGGSGSTPDPSVSPLDIYYDVKLAGYLLNVYGLVSYPSLVIGMNYELGILNLICLNDSLLISPDALRSLGLAVFVWVWQSAHLDLDTIRDLHYLSLSGPYDEEIHDQIHTLIMDMSLGDPRQGDFDVALDLLRGGVISVVVNGLYIPCTGTYIANGCLLPIGSVAARFGVSLNDPGVSSGYGLTLDRSYLTPLAFIDSMLSAPDGVGSTYQGGTTWAPDPSVASINETQMNEPFCFIGELYNAIHRDLKTLIDGLQRQRTKRKYLTIIMGDQVAMNNDFLTIRLTLGDDRQLRMQGEVLYSLAPYNLGDHLCPLAAMLIMSSLLEPNTLACSADMPLDVIRIAADLNNPIIGFMSDLRDPTCVQWVIKPSFARSKLERVVAHLRASNVGNYFASLPVLVLTRHLIEHPFRLARWHYSTIVDGRLV